MIFPRSSSSSSVHKRTSLEGNFGKTFHLIQFTSHNRFQHGVIKHSFSRQEWKNFRGPFAQTLSKVVSILGGVCSRFQFPPPQPPYPPPHPQCGMETVLMLPHITEAEHLMIAYQRARFTPPSCSGGMSSFRRPPTPRDGVCILGFHIF